MGRRTWIKIFADNWLTGTLREETSSIRGTWIDVLALAGDSTYGDEGLIQVADGAGLTDEQIVAILHITINQWLEAKQRLIDTDRIQISKHNVIKIIKWKRYQSEYLRQKPHREKEFVQLRESIKERDGFTCQQCNKSEEELKVPLCIHHINNDSKDNREESLITLCMSCHSHLLKKAVHPTKEKERKAQERGFNKKVQQQSSMEKREERREIKKGEKDISKDTGKPVLPNKDLLDKVYKQGFNIYALLGQFKKKSKINLPEAVIEKVCKSYLKNHEKIQNNWAWFITAVEKASREYFAEQSIKEGQEWKKQPVAQSIKEIMKKAVS